MSISIKAEPSIGVVEHDGKQYPYHQDRRGSFTLTYRSEVVSGPTLSRLRTQMEFLDHEAQVKRERAKALKEAAAKPIPALFGTALEPVGVRGIDQRSNMVLITRANGARESARPTGLFRTMDSSEMEHFLAVMRREDQARAALPSPPTTINSEVDIDLVATYLPALDAWAVDYEGTTIGPAQDMYDLNKMLRTKIEDERYPVRVDHNTLEVRPAGQSERTEYLFASEQEATAFVALRQAFLDAVAEADRTRQEYRFDLSTLSAAATLDAGV